MKCMTSLQTPKHSLWMREVALQLLLPITADLITADLLKTLKFSSCSSIVLGAELYDFSHDYTGMKL